MSGYISLKKKEQIPIKVDGNCSHKGKTGTIIAISTAGKFSRESLTKVRLDDTKEEVTLRVFCFQNSPLIISQLCNLLG